MSATKKILWSILAVFFVIRLFISSRFGLGVDEAHYVLYGLHLDLSYFDHPPLVGWIHYLFQKLPGSSDLLARLPALLISFWTSLLIFSFLLKNNFSEKQSLASIFALNLTPFYNIFSIMLLPDTMLMPLTFLIINETESLTNKNANQNSWRSWFLLGIYLGLAGLSKYTAVLYLPALIIYFFFENRWKILLQGRWIIGIIAALALVSPVIIWNINHQWISFRYQGEHLQGTTGFQLNSFFQTQAIQMLGWGVLFYFFSYWVLFKKIFKPWPLWKIISICFLLYFTFSSFKQTLLPHWMMIFFVLTVPLSCGLLIDKRIFKLACGLSFLMTSLLFLEIGFHIFPSAATAMLYKDIYQWDKIVMKGNEYLKGMKSDKKAMAVMNWTLGSRALYYNKENSIFFVLDNRIDQFDLWNPESPIGYDLLILIENAKIQEQLALVQCLSLDKIGELQIKFSNALINEISYYQCHQFKGLK